jgi:hypothetical protein
MKKYLPPDAETVLGMRGRGNDELAPSKALYDDFKRAEGRVQKVDQGRDRGGVVRAQSR